MLPLALRPVLTAALVCAALPCAVVAGERRAPSGPREPQAAGRSSPFAATAPAGAAAWRDGSFHLRLDARLMREARRYADLAAPPEVMPFEPDLQEDEESRAARSRRVERLLTRALRGALDDHLSDLARSSPVFEGLFRVLDARQEGPARPDPVGTPGSPAFPAAPPARRLETDFRFKIDAHPRLQLRARMGSLTGSIEVPLLDPEVRVGLERPLGAFGRATLQGGYSEGRGDWAAVALNFSF